MRRGLDVSKHQPLTIDWAKLRETFDFVYVRAGYGSRKDVAFKQHVKNAVDAGFDVGAYLFYRRPSDAHQDDGPAQADIFRQRIRELPLTLPPALDVESNARWDHKPLDPSVAADVEACAKHILAEYAQCVIYTTQVEWRKLGNPEFLRDTVVHPLWVAHWAKVETPATPFDLNWAIWQHTVAPVDGYPHPIDQNRARMLPGIIRQSDEQPLRLRPDFEIAGVSVTRKQKGISLTIDGKTADLLEYDTAALIAVIQRMTAR